MIVTQVYFVEIYSNLKNIKHKVVKPLNMCRPLCVVQAIQLPRAPVAWWSHEDGIQSNKVWREQKTLCSTVIFNNQSPYLHLHCPFCIENVCNVIWALCGSNIWILYGGIHWTFYGILIWALNDLQCLFTTVLLRHCMVIICTLNGGIFWGVEWQTCVGNIWQCY